MKYSICFTIACFLIFFGIFNKLDSLTATAGEGEMIRSKSIIFLHHSTGENIIKGDVGKIEYKLFKKTALEKWFNHYNKNYKTEYIFNHINFPKSKPYGWNNYPYDYYNIWVKNAGETSYKDEPTLEMLTKKYDVIMWKHCFPVSNIKDSSEPADIDSSKRVLENYVIQYNALKEKMHQFPDTIFIVWTGAVQVKGATDEAQAKRMRQFVDWVTGEWDEKEDNIFIWDFYALETEGGLYLKDEYAMGAKNSHPNRQFSAKIVPFLGRRIVDVIEGRGDSASLTGK